MSLACRICGNRRREVAIGDVDGDALLAFGAETVGELGEVDGGVVGDGADVVVVDVARIVEQPADQGRLAVIDRAASEEPQERLLLLGGEIGLEV